MNSAAKISSVAAGVLFLGAAIMAQDAQDRPTLNKDKQQSQQQTATTPKLETPGSTAALSEEDTAVKVLQAMPEASVANLQLKLQAAETFLQKYPQSHYKQMIYSFLTTGYIQIGQPDKGVEFGDKEIELNPTDVQTMAVVSQTIPRSFNSADKELPMAPSTSRDPVQVEIPVHSLLR